MTCAPSLTIVKIIPMLRFPCMWSLEELPSHHAPPPYAHCSTVSFSQLNSTSSSCISSTSHGIRDWLATSLIMPISFEYLSLRSATVPWSSNPEWAVPQGPLAIDGLVLPTRVEVVPDHSLIARACRTDSSPSAHSLALVWSCFSVPGIRADSFWRR